jgi:CheY-like chemotaxis protein
MKQRILIVDDEFGLADILSEMLSESGYEVGIAINGELALEAVAQKRPSLILLDNMMPVMDGLTVAQRLKADHAFASIPVVMMTAVPEALPHNAALFNATLRKPFSPEELFDIIGRLVPPSSHS